MLDRASAVDEQFLKRVAEGDFPTPYTMVNPSAAKLDKQTAIDLFDSQIKSRHLDLIARHLKEKGLSFYTIGSSGHEGNAVFGRVFRYNDLAFFALPQRRFLFTKGKAVTLM